MESWQEIKFKNVVKQKYDFSCGSASISTLLKLHDVHVTEIEILDFLKKDYQDIENIAETINNDNIEKNKFDFGFLYKPNNSTNTCI